MSEQINSEQTKDRETSASGLLLSVEPLQASAQLATGDDNADAGADTDGSDKSGADTDLTDSLGADTDGSDAADSDGSDSDDSGSTITIDSAAAGPTGSKFVTAEADSALEVDTKDQ